MKPIERITKRVHRSGDPNDRNTPFALLTLEEFFDGNNVTGSIGCNLDTSPTPGQFYELLRSFLNKNGVETVLVQITAFDDPDWPFSDTVWVITSCSEEEVRSWFPDDLAPNEVWTGWVENQSYEPINIPAGMVPIACWWD
ncbi:MAG: hypothetical protein ACKVQA_11980 [Burkholderiales bacterium]